MMLSLRIRQTSAAREKSLAGVRVCNPQRGPWRVRTHTYLEDVRHVVGGVAVAVADVIVQPHPVLPQLLPDELVVDEGRAPELRQDQPRHQQRFRLVPQRYPVKEGSAMTFT